MLGRHVIVSSRQSSLHFGAGSVESRNLEDFHYCMMDD